MALTPEDIVNKRFQSSKMLREGYDQDEVDDFLDEIVVEMRALIAERDSLRQRLEAAELRQGDTGEVVAPVAAAPAPAASVPATTGELVDEAQSSNSMLVLARRLHDEHVREGIEKRDSLIAEAHEKAEKILSDAETTANTQITKYNAIISELEAKATELREFESEYRSELRSYIEKQLSDLDAVTTVAE